MCGTTLQSFAEHIQTQTMSNKLVVLILTLPKNNTKVSFTNQTTDDLPAKIKGKALWTDHTDTCQSAYYIRIRKYHYSIEYINDSWYHISWDAGTYHMKRSWEITKIVDIGLGAKSTPYLEGANAKRVHSKESNDTKLTTASKTDTEPPEDQDTPIITCQESQIIDQLASIMSTTTIANVSTIPQGTTSLSQVTTAPMQSGGCSGPLGGGAPSG
jgi:hypothetical protein